MNACRMIAALSALLLAGLPALAGAPLSSPRPEPRPLTGAASDHAVAADPLPERVVIMTSAPGVKHSPRPRNRPPHRIEQGISVARLPAARPDRAILVTLAPGVRRSPRPRIRPHIRAEDPLPRRGRAANVTATALAPSIPAPGVATGRQGAVCGDRAIRGQRLSPIRGRLGGCRIANPVRITEIDGIRFSQPAVLQCSAAKALRRWIRKGARPAVGRLGGGIVSMRIMASYACRTRNSQPGAKLSEHARGKAIDIGAITLKNGMTLSVRRGWRDPVQGKILRQMHKAACGPFGTVLGPDANRFHRDHFHFDVARYRRGSYCR